MLLYEGIAQGWVDERIIRAYSHNHIKMMCLCSIDKALQDIFLISFEKDNPITGESQKSIMGICIRDGENHCINKELACPLKHPGEHWPASKVPEDLFF